MNRLGRNHKGPQIEKYINRDAKVDDISIPLGHLYKWRLIGKFRKVCIES